MIQWNAELVTECALVRMSSHGLQGKVFKWGGILKRFYPWGKYLQDLIQSSWIPLINKDSGMLVDFIERIGYIFLKAKTFLSVRINFFWHADQWVWQFFLWFGVTCMSRFLVRKMHMNHEMVVFMICMVYTFPFSIRKSFFSLEGHVKMFDGNVFDFFEVTAKTKQNSFPFHP